jgi:lipoprotein NlpI
MCEGNFYSAEYSLMHQRRTAAATMFRAARDVCPKDYVEYAETLVELKKLGAPTPARPAAH